MTDKEKQELIATVERQRRETEAIVARLGRQIEAMRPYLCERSCKDRKGLTICPYCGGNFKK